MRQVGIALFFTLLVFLLTTGCGADADKTFVLTLDPAFDESEASDCTSYLAKEFRVTTYSETFDTRKVRNFACAKGMDSPEIDLTAGTYYLTVELLDANGNIKSWGSTEATLSGDRTVAVAMRQYRGGITLSWSASLCSDLGISLLKLTALREGDPVTAVVWGQEREVTDLSLICKAGSFSLNNIAAGKYSLTVAGYRSDNAERVRALADLPEFTLVTGQDTPIALKDHLALVVSDLAVTWDFDSKSIASCADAGITTIRTTATGADTEAVLEMPCDTAKRTVDIYDLQADDYTVTVAGLDAAGTVRYDGHKVLSVESGKVGKKSYKLDILIKQQ